MKTKIITLLILSYTIFSCSSSEDIKIESYLKDSITLSINTNTEVSQTVSTMTTKSTAVNETLYENLNLYIFDEKGNLFDYKYTTKSSELNNLKLVVWKEKEYSIYGVANAGKIIHAKTIDELIQKSHTINSAIQIISPNGGVLMTGHIPPSTLKDGMNLELTLVRSIAKISLRIDFKDLSPETSIRLTKVSIKNIPNKVNLFKDSRALSTNDIIIEGDSHKGNEATEIEKHGCSFYIYENMQGQDLLPTNDIEQGKTFDTNDPRAKLCSYIEIESEYSSPDQTGKIKHRFYLGEDYLTNFNIIRNKHYTHTLCFKGSGINEVSWRIDIKDLKEYVTTLSLSPSEHTFRKLGETMLISTTILPHTAFEKKLEWRSSNPSVATVDKSGIIKSIAEGNCTITATTTDQSNKSANTKITVEVPKINISCQEIMFEGESCKAIIAEMTPNNTPITWSSSNNSILTIDQLGNIQAIGIGSAKIKGKIIGNTYSEKTISVVPLKLTLSLPPSTLYKGFKDTINYNITPVHAQKLHNNGKLPITWTSEKRNLDNTDNIYWGTKIGNDQIIGYFTDFSNIISSINTTTLEAFEIAINTIYHNTDQESPYIRILNNATFSIKNNSNYDDISINHPLNTIKHHRAKVSWTSINSSIKVNSDNEIYCPGGDFFATNGKHNLVGSIVDDFNVTHEITIPLRIYEEVNIIILYTISYPIDNEADKDIIKYICQMEPKHNKICGHIDFHYYNDPKWSIKEKLGWNIVRENSSFSATSNNTTHRPKRSGELKISFTDEGQIREDINSPDKRYRYYVSLL